MFNCDRRSKILRLLICVICISFFCVNAKLSKSEKKRIDESVDVISELMNTPDSSIPTEILDKSHCVCVIPSVKKGAFIFGGQYGKGLVTCRKESAGWTAPVFFSLSGGSFGLQIGGQAIDLVLVIMNKRGIEHLLEDKFTLGADASVAAGPVGRTARAETDAQLNAEILAYSRAKGVFAGISLSGSVMKPDKDANRDLYGRNIPAKDILVENKADVPVETEAFIDMMNTFAPVKK